MVMPAPIPVAILDLAALAGFFRSTALAIEAQANTRLEWTRYSDSVALNLTYALMPWKTPPGFAEVKQDWVAIRENTNRRTREMLFSFLDRLHNNGPTAARLYVQQLEGVAARARAGMQDFFEDARNINAMVAGEAGAAARKLAVVQFTCTVLVSVTGCYVALGGAVPLVMMGNMSTTALASGAAATNLGFNIVGAVVKDPALWASAPAVAIEYYKDRVSEVGARWFASVETEAARRIGDDEKLLAAANSKVAEYNAKLGRKLGARRRARYQRGVARSTAEADAAATRMAQQKTRQMLGRVGEKGVPLLFCGWDIYNAWSDASEVWAATR